MTDDTRALRRLHTTLIDSRDGYGESRQKASGGFVRATLGDLAGERARFATEVRAALTTHGAEPDGDGSVLAATHRQAVALRDAMGGDDAAILAEIVRGETRLRDAYDAAIEAANGPDMPMLRDQRAAVDAAIRRLEFRRTAA